MTTWASGLDPDIAPAGAPFQVPRVVQARLGGLVETTASAGCRGIVGEPQGNVLLLNLALDATKG